MGLKAGLQLLKINKQAFINLTDDATIALKNFIKEESKVKIPNSIHLPKDNPYVRKFQAQSGFRELSLDNLNASREFKIGEYFNEKGFLLYPTRIPTFKQKSVNFILKPYKKKVLQRKNQYVANLSMGNYNKQAIEFTPFSNIDDAINFLKKNGFAEKVLGVKKGDALDLERLNILCKSLTNIHNRTAGRAYMQRCIKLKNSIKSSDGYKSSGGYCSSTDTLVLSRELHLDKLEATVYHEAGHATHSCFANLNTMIREGEAYARGLHDVQITTKFLEDMKLQSLIEQYMRSYAKTPAECAADWMKYTMLGQPLPKEINQAVEALGFPTNIFTVA